MSPGTVQVSVISFYLVATVESSSSARTSAIHKEKFNVSLSGDEPIDLSNVVKHLKNFNELAEITKNKGLGEKPEVMIVILCSFIIPEYKKLFLQEPLKTRVNSKYQSKRPIYILYLQVINGFKYCFFLKKPALAVVNDHKHKKPVNNTVNQSYLITQE